MNISFCAYDSPNQIGGPNTVLRRLLPALRGPGCDPRALLLHTGGPLPGATALALGRQGVPTTRLAQPRSTEALLRVLLRDLDDHAATIFAPDYVAPAYYATRWLRPAGVLTIGTIHGDDGFYDALIDAFVAGPPAYRLDGLVCVSHFVEQQVRAKLAGRATDTQIGCVTSGTPLPRESAQPPSNDLRLIYVGRLAETHKRSLDVARAICRAVRALPGTSGAIYGDGPSRRMVQSLLATEGAGLPVRLAGSVDNEQIQAELLRSHALVLLSDSEGLPMAVMEAMACGVVPICLSSPTGALELVQHDVTGLLVDDREQAFVAAVRRLHEEPGLWLRLSRAARARVAAQYTPEHSANQWRAFAAELRERAGPRRPIEIPAHFDLPPVRPGLAHLDARALPPHQAMLRRVRQALGALRRRMRGG